MLAEQCELNPVHYALRECYRSGQTVSKTTVRHCQRSWSGQSMRSGVACAVAEILWSPYMGELLRRLQQRVVNTMKISRVIIAPKCSYPKLATIFDVENNISKVEQFWAMGKSLKMISKTRWPPEETSTMLLLINFQIASFENQIFKRMFFYISLIIQGKGVPTFPRGSSKLI